MGVIIYSFNLNISPKMPYGVLECAIVILRNYIVIKDFVSWGDFDLGICKICVYFGIFKIQGSAQITPPF